MDSLSRRLFLVLTATALSSTGAQAAEPVRLPFQILSGKIFTSAVVNGVQADVMLDSGAALSSLDAAFARRLGVRSMPGARFGGLQGGRWGGMAGKVTIAVAAAVFDLSRIAVIDYADLANSLQRPFQAVLGREFFDRYVVDFDFEGRVLTLLARDGFQAPPGSRSALLYPKDGRLTVDLAVEGGPPLRALVDLGSDAPLILSPGPANARGLLRGRPTSTAQLGGLGRASIGKVATVTSLDLAGVTLRRVPIQVTPRSIGFDANLGLPILRRFRLFLDFAGRRMWLIPGKDVAAPFIKDYTGLSGDIDGAILRISHVAPGGPAERAGWRDGDIVTAINGQAAGIANGALGDAAGPGTVVTFTMANGEKRALTLAEYY